MSNLFGFFFVLYMVILVVEGSIYSNAMQKISKLKSASKTKGVNKKNVRSQINEKYDRIKWIRRATWIIFIGLFLLHLKLISNIRFPEHDVNKNAIYLFVSVCIILFVLNWLIGARIIEKKHRFIEMDKS